MPANIGRVERDDLLARDGEPRRTRSEKKRIQIGRAIVTLTAKTGNLAAIMPRQEKGESGAFVRQETRLVLKLPRGAGRIGPRPVNGRNLCLLHPIKHGQRDRRCAWADQAEYLLPMDKVIPGRAGRLDIAVGACARFDGPGDDLDRTAVQSTSTIGFIDDHVQRVAAEIVVRCGVDVPQVTDSDRGVGHRLSSRIEAAFASRPGGRFIPT
jgi:hypothetical protein